MVRYNAIDFVRILGIDLKSSIYGFYTKHRNKSFKFMKTIIRDFQVITIIQVDTFNASRYYL